MERRRRARRRRRGRRSRRRGCLFCFFGRGEEGGEVREEEVEMKNAAAVFFFSPRLLCLTDQTRPGPPASPLESPCSCRPSYSCCRPCPCHCRARRGPGQRGPLRARELPFNDFSFQSNDDDECWFSLAFAPSFTLLLRSLLLARDETEARCKCSFSFEREFRAVKNHGEEKKKGFENVAPSSPDD